MRQAKFNRVMIIDDNNIDLYVATRVIRKTVIANHISEYTAARQAFQYLKDNSDTIELLPEVILVDIYMPDMSGFEFMQAFDTLPDHVKAYCKAYIISSSLDHTDIERANNDPNVIAFHEKPISTEFLQNITGSR